MQVKHLAQNIHSLKFMYGCYYITRWGDGATHSCRFKKRIPLGIQLCGQGLPNWTLPRLNIVGPSTFTPHELGFVHVPPTLTRIWMVPPGIVHHGRSPFIQIKNTEMDIDVLNHWRVLAGGGIKRLVVKKVCLELKIAFHFHDGLCLEDKLFWFHS